MAALLASAAPAQEATPPAAAARGGAAAEGDAAMTRLRAAIAGQREPPAVAVPTVTAQADPALKRRASDALRQRQAQPVMEARAKAAAAAGRAGLADQREAMAKRLGQALGLEEPDMAARAKGALPAPTGYVPVLFVSSSMPVETLRTYAGQLEQVGGVLAFRGMRGGMTRIAPMAKLSAAILRRDPGCDGPACAMRDVQVIVDPIVFRQHGITRVPAFAMIPGDPTAPYCERDEGSPTASHVVYGDAALSGLLDEYARLGGKEEVRDAQRRLARR